VVVSGRTAPTADDDTASKFAKSANASSVVTASNYQTWSSETVHMITGINFHHNMHSDSLSCP